MLLVVFRFNSAPRLLFLDEEQAHQKWTQTSGHSCEIAFAQDNHPDREKSGGNDKRRLQPETLACRRPTWCEDKAHFEAEAMCFTESLPGAIQNTLSPCLGTSLDVETSTYSSHVLASARDAHKRVCPRIILPCCAKSSLPTVWS